MGFDLPYSSLALLLELSVRRGLMHTDPLFKNLMILKLEVIYSLHLGKFDFFLITNLTPSSFSRSILHTNQVHVYNTRSSNRSHIPLCRTNVRKFSVFFDKMSACIRRAPSSHSFQSRVKNFFYLVTEFIT